MKKILSLVIALTLVLSSMASTSLAAGFSDIDNSYAKDAILKLQSEGILNGTDASHFNPKGTLTRAEFVAIMVRALGLEATATTSSFSDVSGWSVPFVEAAVKAGIVLGTGNGKFSPNDSLTREAAAVILVRSLQYKGEIDDTEAPLNFTDADSISDWAKPFIAIAQKYGLIKGNPDGTFNPQGTANREMSATMGVNLLTAIDEVVVPEKTPEPTPTPTPTPTPPPVIIGGGGSVPPAPTPLQISGESIIPDGAGRVMLQFHLNKTIDLSTSADVIIHFLDADGNEVLKDGAPIVKSKLWSGYLTNFANDSIQYSQGTEHDTNYVDVIPANDTLSTVIENTSSYASEEWFYSIASVKVEVLDNSGSKKDEAIVAMPTSPLAIYNEEVLNDGDGRIVIHLQTNESIDISPDGPGNVVIRFMTDSDEDALANGLPVVKSKAWDGYLNDSNDVKYGQGTEENGYINILPANTLFNNTVDSNTASYLTSEWFDSISYVRIEVTGNDGNTSVVEIPMP